MRTRKPKAMSAGIPTLYKGLRFRSRLEATWAACLDELGIEWQYEPIDLKGYIPDFVLPARKLIVEVKPSLDPTDMWEHVIKIEKSGWPDDVLIVGAAVPLTRSVGLGLSRQLGSWTYEKRTHLLMVANGDALEAAWKAAKNITQWMPSAPKPTSRRTHEPLANETAVEKGARYVGYILRRLRLYDGEDKWLAFQKAIVTQRVERKNDYEYLILTMKVADCYVWGESETNYNLYNHLRNAVIGIGGVRLERALEAEPAEATH